MRGNFRRTPTSVLALIASIVPPLPQTFTPAPNTLHVRLDEDKIELAIRADGIIARARVNPEQAITLCARILEIADAITPGCVTLEALGAVKDPEVANG